MTEWHCRSCNKKYNRQDEHSQRYCLKNKRDDLQRQTDLTEDRNEFVEKFKLKVTKKSIVQNIVINQSKQASESTVKRPSESLKNTQVETLRKSIVKRPKLLKKMKITPVSWMYVEKVQ